MEPETKNSEKLTVKTKKGCGFCVTNTSEGYCKRCKVYMCLTCFKRHLKAEPCKLHELTTKINNNSIEITNTCQDTSIKCRHHKKHAVEFYCLEHDDTICIECKTVAHKTCSLKTLDEAASSYLESGKVHQLLKEIQTIEEQYDIAGQERIDLLKRSISATYEKSVADILLFKASVASKTAETVKIALEKAKSLRSENTRKLEYTSLELETLFNSIRLLKADLNIENEFESTLIKSKEIERLVHQLKCAFQTLGDKPSITEYEFILDNPLPTNASITEARSFEDACLQTEPLVNDKEHDSDGSEETDLPLKLTQEREETDMPLKPIQEREETDLPLKPIQEREETNVSLKPIQGREETDMPLKPIQEREETDMPLKPIQKREEADMTLKPIHECEETDIALKPIQEREGEKTDLPLKQFQMRKQTDLPLKPIQGAEEKDMPLKPIQEREETDMPLKPIQEREETDLLLKPIQERDERIQKLATLLNRARLLHYADSKATLEYMTNEGINVKVYSASLLSVDADCIVNAANGYLQHASGVARVIARHAGHLLVDECVNYIKTNGSLSVGCACSTTAGDLPYKCVVHTVGPAWNMYDTETEEGRLACEEDMFRAVFNALCEAEKKGMKTIAIPAICSGNFGVPIEICTKQYIWAVKQYSARKKDDFANALTDIHFVDLNEATVFAVQEGFIKDFGSQARLVTYHDDDDEDEVFLDMSGKF